MPDPLDLDAICERANRAREVWNRPDTYGVGPQTIRTSAADVPALLAEVERLRTEIDQLASEVAAHQVTDDYGRGHEHGTLAGMKARNVVPRSALVQVGWFCDDKPIVLDVEPCEKCRRVYVIREDTDA